MKSQRVATLLNFLVPGAGLWYLGRSEFAISNALTAFAVLFAWTGWVEGGMESIHYAILAIAAGSAGIAHAVSDVADSPKRTVNSDSPSARNERAA